MTAAWTWPSRLACRLAQRCGGGQRLTRAAPILLVLAAMGTLGALGGAVGVAPAAAAEAGNPYQEHFVRHAPGRGVLLPPPPSPTLFRGSNFQADELAMLENGYMLLGSSIFADGGADARQAVEQGKRVSAAAVVVYGVFNVFPGRPLPWWPNVPDPPAAAAVIGDSMVAAPPPAALAAGYAATYWRKVAPTIFGAVLRALDRDEMARLSRKTGAVVEAVRVCTSAQAANILRGDVLVAIDGKPIQKVAAIDPYLDSIAGRKIHVDLLRDGRPLSIGVQLSQQP
jgi:PDZ domain